MKTEFKRFGVIGQEAVATAQSVQRLGLNLPVRKLLSQNECLTGLFESQVRLAKGHTINMSHIAKTTHPAFEINSALTGQVVSSLAKGISPVRIKIEEEPSQIVHSIDPPVPTGLGILF